MFEEREGIYYAKGKIFIGDTSQSANTDFSDSGRVIKFETSEYYSGSVWITALTSTACGIVIEDHASYWTKFTDGVIVGSDNGRSGSSIIGNDNEDISLDLHAGNNSTSATKLYGTTFKNITGAFNLGDTSNHLMYGCSVIACSQFDPVGAPIIRNTTFAETSDLDSAILWNENINIQYSSFIANTLGAAIEHPSASGTPYSYNNLSFNGNTYDVLNSSGSAITIGLTNSDAAEPQDPSGSEVSFVNNVTLTLTGIKSSSKVFIFDTNETSGSQTDDTILDSTNSTSLTYNSGEDWYEFAFSYNAGTYSGTTVNLKILHLDYLVYKLNYSLTSSSAVIPIQQIIDRNYSDPA